MEIDPTFGNNNITTKTEMLFWKSIVGIREMTKSSYEVVTQ